MKKLVFASFGILLMSYSIAQSESTLKKLSQPSSFSRKAVDIELVRPEKGKNSPVLFSHFEVIDARPDTSFIGVHTETLMLPMTRLRQLILKGSVARAIPDYLNKYFSNSAPPYKVLIVIRKLWISDVTYSYRERESIEDLNIKDDKFNIRLRAEIYVSGDKPYYVPVLRYDSLIVSAKNGYDRIGNVLSGLLQNLADTLSVTDIDFPIFRDRVLVKGVYANFDEFRNNAPSIKDYEIGTEKKKSVLYTRDPSGHSYYNHNAWGVCDGKNLYVMLEGYVFAIFREQNAFYLSGFIETKDNPGELREEIEEYKRQLEMEKGEGIDKANYVADSKNLDQLNDQYKYSKTVMKRQTRVFAIDPDTGIIY